MNTQDFIRTLLSYFLCRGETATLSISQIGGGEGARTKCLLGNINRVPLCSLGVLVQHKSFMAFPKSSFYQGRGGCNFRSFNYMGLGNKIFTGGKSPNFTSYP